VAGHRYVVLVGRVPLAKQVAAYLETFADAADRRPGDEAPDYRGAVVERAEVVTGASNEKLKWIPLSAQTRKEIQQGWAGARRNEPASAALVNSYLTEPLPPRTGGDFLPEEIVHSTMRDLGPAAVAPAPAKAEPAAPDEIDPNAPDVPAADKPAEPAVAADADAAAAAAPSEEALLFRYFDFTVEPGKQYRYRVKLWLANPNYEVDAAQLTQEALQQREQLQKTRAKDRFVQSPESAPTVPVYIPYDGVLVAGEWSPATPAKEPSVSVAVEQWTANDGATAQYVKGPVYRGQLVNFQVARPSDGPGVQPPGAAVFELGDNVPKKNEEDIPFRTEVAVLDMAPSPADGGGAARTVPADILVLDAAGRLRVCTAREMAERFREINENFGLVNAKDEAEGGPPGGKPDPLDVGAGRPPRPPR
jgi:hypothetical protein